MRGIVHEKGLPSLPLPVYGKVSWMIFQDLQQKRYWVCSGVCLEEKVFSVGDRVIHDTVLWQTVHTRILIYSHELCNVRWSYQMVSAREGNCIVRFGHSEIWRKDPRL